MNKNGKARAMLLEESRKGFVVSVLDSLNQALAGANGVHSVVMLPIFALLRKRSLI